MVGSPFIRVSSESSGTILTSVCVFQKWIRWTRITRRCWTTSGPCTWSPEIQHRLQQRSDWHCLSVWMLLHQLCSIIHCLSVFLLSVWVIQTFTGRIFAKLRHSCILCILSLFYVMKNKERHYWLTLAVKRELSLSSPATYVSCLDSALHEHSSKIVFALFSCCLETSCLISCCSL